MAQGDWIIFLPAVAGYLIWPIYRLTIGSKKSLMASILNWVFWGDLCFSVFLTLDMIDMQKRHVTDAGDTIMVIIFVALLSFVISVLTIATGILIGLTKKLSKT